MDILGEKATRCKSHCEDGMINVMKKRCGVEWLCDLDQVMDIKADQSHSVQSSF